MRGAMYQLAQWIVRNKAIAFAVAAMTVVAMAPDEGEGTLLPTPDAVASSADGPVFTLPRHRAGSESQTGETGNGAIVAKSIDGSAVEIEDFAAGPDVDSNAGSAPRVIYVQPPRRVRPPKDPEY